MEIKRLDDRITLVGVDYISGEEMREPLLDLIKRESPDTLAVTLCKERFETMDKKSEWERRQLLPSYKKGETGALIYMTFIDAIQENLRKFKNLEPERNIASLIPMMKDIDTDVEFVDRDITVTLSRAFHTMSPLKKLKMMWYFKSAILSFSGKKKYESVKDMDQYDDMIDGVLDKFGQFAPDVADVAKRERTEYMSKKVYDRSKKGRVLALIPESKLYKVGREIGSIKREEKIEGGHGVLAHLEELSKRVYTKALRFASPAFFITLAAYLFFFSDVMNIWRAWLFWFLAVGGMSAVGSAIGRGHPLSILTSFLLAPIMSLTLIGPGWIAGYVELKLREPQVKDLKKVTESSSFNEFLSNDIIRIFTVGTFSNIFTWLGLFIVLPLFIRFFG